jgi:hypothetical protein
MRKLLLAPFLAAALIGLGVSTAEAQGIRVNINGNPVMFNGVGPREVNGRVLVPLRGVLEQLGAYVEYDVATRSVIAMKGDTEIALALGDRTATINGEEITMDVPAMSIAGSTMVPLRFVSEALGARVRWNPNNQVVAINTSAQVAEVIERPNRAFRRPRPGLPVVTSVSHNINDGFIDPGDLVRVTMRATPDGTGYFRIRGMVGQIKMTEIEPGLYEGLWRADVGVPVELNEDNILAFVLVGDRATAEMRP